MGKQTIKNNAIQEINEKYQERLEYMSEAHSQVVVGHLVATWPNDIPFDSANQVVGSALNALRKTLSNRGIESQGGWVREVSPGRDDGKPHYHIGLICDGNKTQSVMACAQDLNRIVTKKLNKPSSSTYVKCAPPQTSPGSTLKLRRNQADAEEQKKNISDWLSYHAKTDGKGQVPSHTREYGFSHLPKKIEKQDDVASETFDE